MFSLEENALKAALVRLGHQGSDLTIPDQIGGCLPMGVQIDIPVSNVRVCRTEDQIKIWDLAHANKRGKYVLMIHLYNLKDLREPLKTWVVEWLIYIGKCQNFHTIHKSAENLNRKLGGGFLELHTIKAIRVAPFGFSPIKIKNEYFELNSDWDGFSLEFKEGPLITPKGVKSIKKLYYWAKEFSKDILKLDEDGILEAIDAIGVKYRPEMRSRA